MWALFGLRSEWLLLHMTNIMKYALLLSFLCTATLNYAQTNKSDEVYFRIGVLGNYYLTKQHGEYLRTYSDGTTDLSTSTVDLNNGGLGLYSTIGYAFGNNMRLGIEGKGYIYKDDSYFIGLFGMMTYGPVVEYEASEALTLYAKASWNFDYAFKNYDDRKAYSIGAGGYVAIPNYPFAMVRINLEYMATGGAMTNYYDYDSSLGGVQLTQEKDTYQYRGLLAEVGISVGI